MLIMTPIVPKSRSILECGLSDYTSAHKNILHSLNYIYHEAIQLAIGALSTSSIPSVTCETEELLQSYQNFNLLITLMHHKSNTLFMLRSVTRSTLLHFSYFHIHTLSPFFDPLPIFLDSFQFFLVIT